MLPRFQHRCLLWTQYACHLKERPRFKLGAMSVDHADHRHGPAFPSHLCICCFKGTNTDQEILLGGLKYAYVSMNIALNISVRCAILSPLPKRKTSTPGFTV